MEADSMSHLPSLAGDSQSTSTVRLPFQSPSHAYPKSSVDYLVIMEESQRHAYSSISPHDTIV